MAAQHHRRRKAMRYLRNGLVTVTEAAQLAIVSRQRVREWCKSAGIDPIQARKAWVTARMDELKKGDKS